MKDNYEKRANVGIWTRDLFLTKETLYPWATSAVQVVWHDLVERETGFEPATFSLEGWRSTNWATPALLNFRLWGEQDSNLRRWKPTDLQSVLVGRLSISPKCQWSTLVEPMEGLEPTTCWLQISCSSQLSYIGNYRLKAVCKCI